MELAALAALSLCDGDLMYQDFVARIRQNYITRAENRASHFSAYFLPHDPQSQTVFMVDHRKSGLWLSPGGYLEPGETLIYTLNRETEEELGIERPFSGREKPFMLSISDIANPSQECFTHFDVRYLLQNDGRDFQPDSREVKETRWLDFHDARNLVTDRATLRALDIVEGNRT